MKLDITQYKSIVFDVHGVVLDSNITKIDSYFRTAKKLGGRDEQAQALVDYHVKHSGIASYPKFKWYIEEVLEEKATDQYLQEYIDAFSLAVTKGLSTCRVAAGLEDLRERTVSAKWFLVTEGDQAKTQALFKKRELAHFFDGGIFGYPSDKKKVLSEQIVAANIMMPALFIGDSKYDYEVAREAGLDFVFLTNWTDLSDWDAFCKENAIEARKSLMSL